MAKPVFKHQDDDGDLSIFASGDFIILACEHGHYWAVNSKEQSSDSMRAALDQELDRDQIAELFRSLQ